MLDVKQGNKAEGKQAQEQSTDTDQCHLLCPHASHHFVVCHIVDRRFEASWPAYAQGEAFVHLFTIICCEQFSKAGGRNPALWDKRPFVFNQSPSLNEKMFQMTRVKWKGGLGSHGTFRNQIRPQKRCSAGESHEKSKFLTLHRVLPNTTFPILTHGLLKFSAWNVLDCPDLNITRNGLMLWYWVDIRHFQACLCHLWPWH